MMHIRSTGAIIRISLLWSPFVVPPACSSERLPEHECAITEQAGDNECTDGIGVDGRDVAPVCNLSASRCYRIFRADCDDDWCTVPSGGWRAGRATPLSSTEYPRFNVILTHSFRMARTEVTVRQWLEIMGGDNPSLYKCGEECPVTHLSVFDALEYANRLSALEDLEPCYDLEHCTENESGYGRTCDHATYVGPDCRGYRLPSEMEFELAANGGSDRCFEEHQVRVTQVADQDTTCTGWQDFTDYPAIFCGNSEVTYEGCINLSVNNGPRCAGPMPVRARGPNRFGLYDMHGNVAELTGSAFTWPTVDNLGSYQSTLEKDPGQTLIIAEGFLTKLEHGEDGPLMTVRGGSFMNPLSGVCASSRVPRKLTRPANGFDVSGFRLVRTVSE